MASELRRGPGTPGGRARWSGIAAAVGAILWTTMPWLKVAALGTRPYEATGFDPFALLGWVLMAAGLYGFAVGFRDRLGLPGRIGFPVAAVGMGLVTVLLASATVQYVAAGFAPVPAGGEDPLSLVLAYGGYGLTLLGSGLLGIALWRLPEGHALPAVLLVLAAVAPGLLLLAPLGFLPGTVRSAVVAANWPLFPLGIAWIALGHLVFSDGDRGPDGA